MGGGGKEVHVKIVTETLPSDGYDFRPIKIGKSKGISEIIIGRVTITVIRTNQRIEVYTKDGDVARSWPDKIDKSGITDWRKHVPSVDDGGIYYRSYQRGNYYLDDAPPFGIRYLDTDRCESFHRRHHRCYGSSYMTSDEVKAEYFPEDIEE